MKWEYRPGQFTLCYLEVLTSYYLLFPKVEEESEDEDESGETMLLAASTRRPNIHGHNSRDI